MQETKLISAFLTHQTGRGFSPKTVMRRRSSLTRFVQSIAPLRLSDATPELVDEWVHTFKSLATRHAYRSDIIAFYAWANKRRIMTRNPAADTDTIKTPRTLPRPISTELIPLIIDTCNDRDIQLWCALAAHAGLRISEIADLSREDVTTHGTNPNLVVRSGKGRKDRIIPLHPRLAELIGPYRTPGPLFSVDSRAVGKWGALHIRSCGADATMHQLRHTFGTELARVSGGNVVLVAYLMGHASMSTTMKYIGWAGGANTTIVGQMYDHAHPEDLDDAA